LAQRDGEAMRWRSLVAAASGAATAAAVAYALSSRDSLVVTARAYASPSVAAASSPGGGFRVLRITGDGRCLFRSVVQAHAHATTGALLAPAAELAAADALRASAMDELARRRDEYEWAVEGDFSAYVAAMRRPSAWGGEMELLMAAQVLRAPIAVAVAQPELRVIATYGEEFASKGARTAHVLFHGEGHYEALLADEAPPRARL
jgi:OTU domain-containing protein 6